MASIELRGCVPRAILRHQQDREVGPLRVDESEVVEGKMRVRHQDVDRNERRRRCQHDGVAVRRLLQEPRRSDQAAGAGAVDHRHRLAEILRHELGEAARKTIRAAADVERHQNGEGASRPPLRPGRQDTGGRQGGAACEKASAFHRTGSSLTVLLPERNATA